MKARKSLTRFASFLALMAAICLVFSAAAEDELSIAELSPEDVEEVSMDAPLIANPLPIDFTGGFAPLESGYLGDSFYQDPTIQVEITYKDVKDYIKGYKGRDAGAWIVDVRIGDASQLRTAAAEAFDKKTTLPVETIADRLNAVVAFNADYITRQDDGYIYREGVLFKDKLKGKRDVLLIDEDGDFHPVHLPKRDELSDTVDGKKVLNSFCFGPILVENGEVLEKMPNFTYLKPENYYARLAICQVGPLHYKVILTTMEQDYTLGLQLKSFAQLCKDEGAIVAYNLDGGYSTTLYFHGIRLNSQKNVNFREVPDIFYFASAWDGGNAE
jgi:exopolysaccharide biosynthesis protein